MKLILPVALSFLAVACVAPKPPKPGTAAFQLQLEKEARENFYAMKEKEQKLHPHPVVAQTEPPAKVRLKPFTATSFEFVNPFASTKPAAIPKPMPAPKPATVSKPTPVLKPFNPVAVVKPTPVPKPPKPIAVAKPTPAPKPPKSVAVARSTPAPKPSKPIASTSLFARSERPRKADETVYYYDVPHGPEPTSPRYRAYKAQYARELAKRPEDLTPEEREWVRRHYRD